MKHHTNCESSDEIFGRHGDQVVWPDHPEHQTVKLVCEQLSRLDSHQNLVAELQAEVANVETARQQELAESRVAWIQLEQQVALAQQRLSTTQSGVFQPLLTML